MPSSKYRRNIMSSNFLHVPRNRQVFIYVVSAIALVFGIALLNKLYDTSPYKCPYVWHGGSPTHNGNCWCGSDNYCSCTPSLAIDAIIEYQSEDKREDTSLLLVYRRDPPKDLFAIPGGFVNLGETVESAAMREVKEETNLTVAHLEQFRMYSDPTRDKRRHTASMVFRCVVHSVASLHTGDDAKSVKLVPLKDLLQLQLAFDHRQILTDYLEKFHKGVVVKT
jgi:8-oxo-dGTP diphosphatase